MLSRTRIDMCSGDMSMNDCSGVLAQIWRGMVGVAGSFLKVHGWQERPSPKSQKGKNLAPSYGRNGSDWLLPCYLLQPACLSIFAPSLRSQLPLPLLLLSVSRVPQWVVSLPIVSSGTPGHYSWALLLGTTEHH